MKNDLLIELRWLNRNVHAKKFAIRLKLTFFELFFPVYHFYHLLYENEVKKSRTTQQHIQLQRIYIWINIYGKYFS